VDENPIDFTTTSETGAFSFSELAFGTYKLTVEMPGINSETAIVELGENNLMEELHFYVQDKNAYLGAREEQAVFAQVGNIYPNPVLTTARLNIKVTEKTEVLIRVISQTGAVVVSYPEKLEPGNQVLQISSSSLKPGLYTIQVIDGMGNSVTRKFIK
jgi:hypothetical protein